MFYKTFELVSSAKTRNIKNKAKYNENWGHFIQI